VDVDGFEYGDAGRDASRDAGIDGAMDATSDVSADVSVDVIPDAFDASIDGFVAPQMPNFAEGDFSRDSQATVSSDASGIVLTIVDADVRRFQRTPTGESEALLLEGAGSNRATTPLGSTDHRFLLEEWDHQMPVVEPTFMATPAPDGMMLAQGFVNDAANKNQPRCVPGLSSDAFTVSIFVKRGVGGSSLVMQGPPRESSRMIISPADTPTAGWHRFDATWNGLADAEALQYQILIANGQNLVDDSTGVPGDYHFWWGAQIEDGLFPTSFIGTEGGTRAFDRLVFTESASNALLDDFEMRVWPSFGADDMIADQAFVLLELGTDGSNVLRLVNGLLELWSEGALAAQTASSAFARDEELLIRVRHGTEVTLDPASGGVRTGMWNDEVAPWSAGYGSMRVGARNIDDEGRDAFFGLVAEPTAL